MLSSKIDTYIMLFAIYLDGTVYISELFWNFLSFIHNNRIIMGGHFFSPIVFQRSLIFRRSFIYSELVIYNFKELVYILQ